jgi:hypothetical protein
MRTSLILTLQPRLRCLVLPYAVTARTKQPPPSALPRGCRCSTISFNNEIIFFASPKPAKMRPYSQRSVIYEARHTVFHTRVRLWSLLSPTGHAVPSTSVVRHFGRDRVLLASDAVATFPIGLIHLALIIPGTKALMIRVVAREVTM